MSAAIDREGIIAGLRAEIVRLRTGWGISIMRTEAAEKERDEAIERIEIWNGRYNAAIAERDGLRRAIEAARNSLDEIARDAWMLTGARGIAWNAEKSQDHLDAALAVVPAPAPVDGGATC